MTAPLDINPTHGLALVAGMPDFSDPHYVPLTDELRSAYSGAPGEELYYIRQAHTVASTVAQGLVAMDRGTPRTGWIRVSAQPEAWGEQMPRFLWFVSDRERAIQRGAHEQAAFALLDERGRAIATHAEFCVKLPRNWTGEENYHALQSLRSKRT